MSQETHNFQAETKRLLDLMIHSLYSNKDIFLRELISNASDALDKRRFAALTEPAIAEDNLHIRLDVDTPTRTLSIRDNGIGMTKEDLVNNLGTIARSGTKEFLEQVSKSDAQSRPDLIGQFGVGFYSSFLVANQVTVVSRKAGTTLAHKWVSTGDGSYTIETVDDAPVGTTVSLLLKPANDDEGIGDYTNTWTLRQLVQKYSDFVAYPIITQQRKAPTGDGDDKTIEFEDKTLNSMKAIWMRPEKEVTDEEYQQFYRHLTHDWHDPAGRVLTKIEGTIEARALLFVPSTAPRDLFRPDMSRAGVHLYVKRIFILDECTELLPNYLRFVKGVVDAEDLPLNVSREVLQSNGQVRVIKRQLVKKTVEWFAKKLTDDRAGYEALWKEFGAVLKEGLLHTPERNEKVLDLVLATSVQKTGSLISLQEYADACKPEQEAIYYLTSPTADLALNSPHLEAFKAKGIDVLIFTDPVDEMWLQDNHEGFGGKKFVAADGSDVKLPEGEEAKKATEENKATFADLLSAVRASLQDDVKDVRLSDRLTNSAACLISDKGDMTPQMERLMRLSGQNVPRTKRILEINPTHPAVLKLQERCKSDKDSSGFKDLTTLLYGQALLAEGGHLENPAAFAKLVTELMARA
ncbi:MAG: molecular chaperone HtpG [Deltaproteobacteria bacterium]|nr:molecular chaperone HtpG [Deltaproteobacteria bacterium]